MNHQQSHQATKGKQDILYGNVSRGGIVIITVLFFLNVGLFFLVDCFLVHPLSGKDLEARVPGEILSTYQVRNGMLILYRQNGVTRLAEGSENLLNRWRLDLEKDTITEDPQRHDGALLDYTVENGQIVRAAKISLLSPKIQLGAILVVCFLVTALERMLFQKLRGQ